MNFYVKIIRSSDNSLVVLCFKLCYTESQRKNLILVSFYMIIGIIIFFLLLYSLLKVVGLYNEVILDF